MRGFFFFLALIFLVFFGGFGVAHFEVFKRLPFPVQKDQVKGFLPALHPSERLPFCVVIVGKNNGAYLEKSLLSAAKQSYENFRVIYIDDGSEDGSFSLAEEIVERDFAAKVKILRNEKSLGVFPSLERILDSCKEGEIVVLLDGKNWLAHDWVLERLNQYYADPDLWMTVGQTIEFPSYELPKEALDFLPFQSFHTRLIKENSSLDAVWEASEGHRQNLSDILCIHPLENP